MYCIRMNVVYLLLQSKLMFLSTNFCALGQSHKCILIPARLTIADSGLGFSRIFYTCNSLWFSDISSSMDSDQVHLHSPALPGETTTGLNHKGWHLCRKCNYNTSRDYKSILCHPPPPMNEKSIAYWYLLFIFLFVDSSMCMCVWFLPRAHA